MLTNFDLYITKTNILTIGTLRKQNIDLLTHNFVKC